MKNVLIITNYYPPETGAAANRISQLAKGLQKHNFEVSIVTPLPNYPTGKIFENYRGHLKISEVKNGIKIHRLWVYASNSKNKFLRLFAMVSYSLSLIWFISFNKIPKRVIIQSPPLLVAFTSVLFLRSKKRKLVLNISDLWPLAGLELGVFREGFAYRLLQRIESFNYRNADLILGQSEEILTHITSQLPDKQTFIYRNYPNFEPPSLPKREITNGKLKIVYAGLLGVAQGIYKLCTELDYTNIQLHLYGTGAEQKKIEGLIKSKNDLDIVYHGEISREKLHQELIKYDITIIPLLNRIYGSVPSKIFEYAYLGLPMIYFGGGEGEDIIKMYRLGWVVKVGNYDDLNNIIKQISSKELSYDYKNKIQSEAFNNFNLDKQINELILDI